MVQTSSGFSGRFWPIRRPLFQGLGCREEATHSVVMIVSIEADPSPPIDRSAFDRPA